MRSLLKNTAILGVGALVIAAGDYAFHPIMARLLTVAQFGELQSIMSLMYIVGIPAATIATVAKKKTAEWFSENELARVKAMMVWINKTFLMASGIGTILLLALSPLITSFLKLESSWGLIVLFLFFPFSFLAATQLAILEGLHRFGRSSLNGVLSTIAKLVLGVLMTIWLGIPGAIASFGLANVIPLLLVIWQTRDLPTPQKKDKEDKWLFINYSFPTFLFILCLTLLYSWDIILAKHYLPAIEAGEYAALSLFGKIVLFGSGPIIQALFPMTAAGHKDQGKNFTLILQGLLLVSLGGTIISLIFFFIPEMLVPMLLGNGFLNIIPHLSLIGIIFTLLSLNITIGNFFISTGKWKGILILIFSIILMTGGIASFHNNLTEILKAMLAVEAFTFLSLLTYLLVDHSKNRR